MDATGLIASGVVPHGAGPLLANVSSSQITLLIVVLGVTAVMLITARRRMRDARNSPRAYAREQINRLKEQRRVQSEVGDVMVELEQLSRQISAQIETRFVKLEAVLRAADERIDTLERLIRQSEGKPTIDVIANNRPDAPAPDSRERTRQRIYQLDDAGYSPVEIAPQVGHTAGEVELILALRRNVASQS
jgi:uncharacterized protein YifE (UPF0438 family)